MAEDDPREHIWTYVAAEAAARFGRRIGHSPTLSAAINFGSHYVNVETDALLFDTSALTLGLLAAGTPGPTGVRYGNAAFWFREWLQARISPADVDAVLVTSVTDVTAVEKAIDQKIPVALSISVEDLIGRAGDISQATLNRTVFDARHLFAAMIQKGTVVDQLRQLFNLALGREEMTELKRRLVDGILESPEAGETRESWEAALGLAKSPLPIPPPPVPPPPGGPSAEEIMRFDRDGARRGDNVLEIKRDVEALAKLICLKGSTPLAVAIFGGWGSGKTTFMDALDEKIEAIALAEARRTRDGAAGPFVTRIVQIKFNAWQFVDANLWASLTAEFFDQLRAGGHKRVGTVRHAGLVEKVNSHVHSLTNEAKAHRAAVIESNRQVLKAQEARDTAATAVRQAKAKAIGQAAIDTLGDIYEGQKNNLRALGIAAGGKDPTQGVDAVIEAVRSSRSIVAQAWTILRMVWKYRAVAAVLGVALLLLAGAGFWALWSGSFDDMDVAATLVTAVGLLGSLATFWHAAAPAVRLVSGVARRGADLARTLKVADKDAVKELIGKEAALRDATAEAEAQARVAERAERALARYVDPAGPSNPPRLLRYVLEDDPETKAFEKEIGLIGRARRLFQAVDDIIVKGDGESPQRIVIYIDDLDRCTEEQVYNVLQAINLLLAFESFAVVVGVDVKWIEGALAAEFAADRLPPLSEIDRRQHAVHYLEKIFQVAFWLDPLSSSGDEGGSFAAFVRALTKPVERAGPPSPSPVPDSAPAEVEGNGPEVAPDREEADAAPAEAAARVERATLMNRLGSFFARLRRRFAGEAQAEAGGDGEARPVLPATEESTPIEAEPEPIEPSAAREAFRTVELDPIEIEFLASPEIAGLAGSTPRSVKRLINVYRLVRSQLADDGVSLLGTASAPPAYPLAALATAVETGQPVEVAAALMCALRDITGETEIVGPEKASASNELGLETAFQALLAAPLRTKDADGNLPTYEKALASKCPGLPPALFRAHRLRNGQLAARDLLRVVRLARRYSFNRHL